MAKKKLELGDIFELKTKKGDAYIQCVEIPNYNNRSELIKVFYQLHDEKPQDLNSILDKDYFYTRFPVRIAAFRKIITKIGNIPLPENFKSPEYYRDTNAFGTGWQIVNEKTYFRTNVDELSAAHLKLSPWGGMNDTLIKELLENGWRLEKWNNKNKIMK
ncbi:hypothetical protein OX283_004180 [Flavobacterium sp. SUN052]|uniref:hypothetical protein n=1 Tax=Flavobacterium sp. SUN052 TaxID=3002441 RepID=UPI00237EC8B1|nr:hypothetical protein [Flavobacterium sp. SUN052]MEC4003843.1 hypothetical protein [Flavobacterium sp. SUN052]